MRRNSRLIMIGAFALIFFLSGCGAVARANPTPVWTIPPSDQPVLPTTTIVSLLPTPAAPTDLTVTPLIPITGENVVSMQCQFCVDAETHAILIFPDFAYFDVSSDAAVSCLTADVVNGKRILICRGTQSRTFNLNICSDPENCLQYPVALQPCHLLQAGATPAVTNTPFVPVFLTPINTLRAPNDGPTATAATAAPSSTATLSSISATATLPASTPTLSLPTVSLPTSTTEPPPQPTEPSQPPPDTATPELVAPTQGSGGVAGEIVICHTSPGNPGGGQTMTISQTDWNGHRRHGDSLGPCP